jgi:hypothetical protein
VTDCLHCDINDLVRERIEGKSDVGLSELVAKMSQSLAELICSRQRMSGLRCWPRPSETLAILFWPTTAKPARLTEPSRYPPCRSRLWMRASEQNESRGAATW